jgi:hypothetical protein
MHRLFGLLAATSWRENSMIVSLEICTSLSRKRGQKKKQTKTKGKNTQIEKN